MRRVFLAAVLAVLPGWAAADFERITSKTAFVSIVAGKTLSRPLISVRVDPRGEITGKGARWPISGEWSWQGGYFCRTLSWGGDNLGYNCQEVSVRGGKVRFRSDKGRGDWADFTLR